MVTETHITSVKPQSFNLFLDMIELSPYVQTLASFGFFICPIAIAYSMGQITKPFCLCLCVQLRALSCSHFMDLHQNWHRCKKSPKV